MNAAMAMTMAATVAPLISRDRRSLPMSFAKRCPRGGCSCFSERPSASPQAAQNRSPGSFGVPHRGQYTRPSYQRSPGRIPYIEWAWQDAAVIPLGSFRSRCWQPHSPLPAVEAEVLTKPFPTDRRRRGPHTRPLGLVRRSTGTRSSLHRRSSLRPRLMLSQFPGKGVVRGRLIATRVAMNQFRGEARIIRGGARRRMGAARLPDMGETRAIWARAAAPPV